MLQVGKRAPDFDMPSTKDMKTLKENVRLSDYRGKFLVMFFYPSRFHLRLPNRTEGIQRA